MKQLRTFFIILFLFTLVAQPAAVVSGQVNIPFGATVTSATLSFYLLESSLETGEVHRITSNWTEDTVTWNSFFNAYDPAVVTTFTPTNVGWSSVDVTPLVQQWINGDVPNYGLLLRMPPPLTDDRNSNRFHSSEAENPDRRPKLDVCYTVGGGSETCVTIKRDADETGEVYDTYVRSNQVNNNFGDHVTVYTEIRSEWEKYALLRFDFNVDNPGVSIIKYTNGQEASDPDGTDVPRIVPGQPVVWTYRVSNTGNVAVPRAEVVVTDNQQGVMPAYDSEITGNGDTVFDPGEVWLYRATGTAVNLSEPPDGVMTFEGYCTNGGTETPRTAYINQGTVAIPGGVTDTAQSSYCNPPEQLVTDYKLYGPIVNSVRPSIVFTPFRVTIGYEDLPLDRGLNDYDYNDWIVDIHGTGIFESVTSDRLNAIELQFDPNGRGAQLVHSFHMRFPSNTFTSGGTYTLTTYGPPPAEAVLSTQTGSFSAGGVLDLNIFPRTDTVFPGPFKNTVESEPVSPAQRSAKLRLDFSTPVMFNFADYDYTTAHGAGLFFDPYIKVPANGEEIHRGDLRMLNVPEIEAGSPIVPYEWPEEWVRIDRAYPDLTFIPANPPTQPVPDIIFPDGWWLNNNNCVIDDVPCDTSVRPVNPLDFSYFDQ